MTLKPMEANQPESMESWHSEAPARLVAWALRSLGGEGKAGEIKQKLAGQFVPAAEWTRWWKRVQPAVKKSSRFTVKKNNSISFYGSVTAVPAEPLSSLSNSHATSRTRRKAPTKADWRRWFLARSALPCPGTYPTNLAIAVIRDLKPRDDVNLVLEKTFWSAGTFLASAGSSERSAAGWMEALSRMVLKCAGDQGMGPANAWARPLGATLGRLANVARYSEDSLAWLLRVYGLGSGLSRWRREFSAGMWAALREHGDPQHLLRASSSGWQRIQLAEDFVIAAFNTFRPAPRHSELDRLLDALSPGDRAEVLLRLMVQGTLGESPRPGTLNYIANSRHASASFGTGSRLELLTAASLLLSEGDSAALAEASSQIGKMMSGGSDESANPVWDSLLSNARQEVEILQTRLAEELETQRLSFERILDQKQQDLDGLSAQNRTFRALMESGREESRFEIRKDMLLEVGDIMQRVHRCDKSPADRLEEVRARLTVVLNEGGASPLGTAGEMVPFDPGLHHSADAISTGAIVRLLAPGVITKNEAGVGRVLLKASVTNKLEVT